MKLALITPWYGSSTGGAEVLCRGLAKALKAHGYAVEVLSTCALDPYTPWDKDVHAPEVQEPEGITVRRFPVDARSAELYAGLHRHLEAGEQLSKAEQQQFFRHSINSSELNQFIQMHGGEYWWIFLPYLYGTTFWGVQLEPERSLVIPCLHREPVALLDQLREVMHRVRAMLFLSEPEMVLAKELFELEPSQCFYLGGGVELKERGRPERFREKFALPDEYLIYVGKKERGKGVNVLIDYFQRYNFYASKLVKLVMAGAGELTNASLYVERDWVKDVGILSEEEKTDALSGSTALCLPSRCESFSLVMMEAWVQERPVLVDGHCEVARWHCERSGGGLWYDGLDEFLAEMQLLATDPERCEEMGRQGRTYVEQNFTWENVVQRFKTVLEAIE